MCARRASIFDYWTESRSWCLFFIHSLLSFCVALAIFNVVSPHTTFLFRCSLHNKSRLESDSFLTFFCIYRMIMKNRKRFIFIELIKKDGMVPWNWLAWSRDVWKRAFIINALQLTKCVHLSLKYAANR